MDKEIPRSPSLKFLEDRWDLSLAATLDGPEQLRYRSNLLGSDLRITNFAGGNTSSKITEADPLTGEKVEILWVKGSGGDLGSIQRAGFATLYLKKFLALERSYKGIDTEDEMVAMYPGTAFRGNPVAASIDTPLHGFLPFPHCDHLHPDWGIALAAAANGKTKMEEFNRDFGHSLVWMPWLRPGFELGLRMRSVVAENPKCDGIVLGGHGLFTWGRTQRECYLNTITVIDQIGQFIERHGTKRGPARFGGQAVRPRANRSALALQIAPYLRGRLSLQHRYISSFTDAPDALQFVNSAHANELAFLGTSCPDHFIRTKIRPLFIRWKAGATIDALKQEIDLSLIQYREKYRAYYHSFATPESPALRDTSPAVVLISGLGIFSFGKNKTEARIAGEFYLNAIHVMEGATLLAEGAVTGALPQCAKDTDPSRFKVFTNYVALPPVEAFRIEYWAMEDAKIRRQPPEKELSRRIVLVVGATAVGRDVALKAAALGAHLVIADTDEAAVASLANELKSITSAEFVASTPIDTQSRESIANAFRTTVHAFGGLDILINASAPLPAKSEGDLLNGHWATTLDVNVMANYLVADEATKLFVEQGLDGSIVMTGSANSASTKPGSEAHEVSKSVLSHLIREFAAGLAPRVRVNGIILAKAAIDSDQGDCAEAILFLASPRARSIDGHLISIDSQPNPIKG